MKTLIIDAASIDSMYTIHDRFIAAFDFAECYGETLDSLHDYLCEINKFDAHAEAVVLQGFALPLGQRLDDLHLDAAVLGVEGDLPLDAVQIVVQAGRSLDEERCRQAVGRWGVP